METVTKDGYTVGMKPAKIGIDARLLAYRKGGIAEYTRQLIEALARLDTQNQYTILHRYNDKENYCPAPNFRRGNVFTPAHHRLERSALAVELMPRHLDLLHSPDFIPPRWGAKHQIITIHDLHFLHYPQFQTADSLCYYRDQIAWAVKHAEHILVQTESTRHEIMEMLGVPADKITVHLLGVNAAFRPMPKDEVDKRLAPYKLPAEYLLFVGTIEPRKNIPGLLEAYARLRAEYGDAVPPLVLGGQVGWNAEDSLAAIERFKLNEVVIRFENVPFEVLPALYNRARVLIQASFHEGFGLPPLEAMACGVPVVVARRGGLPEVVSECGVYVEPESVESIAEGIWRVLSDTALATQLAADGQKRAALFSWERTAAIALETYRRVLDL